MRVVDDWKDKLFAVVLCDICGESMDPVMLIGQELLHSLVESYMGSLPSLLAPLSSMAGMFTGLVYHGNGGH